jgi:hypothetical protein
MTVFSIGTRGFPLALAQVSLTGLALAQVTGLIATYFSQKYHPNNNPL